MTSLLRTAEDDITSRTAEDDITEVSQSQGSQGSAEDDVTY